MKKLFVITLAVAMTLAMATTCFAAIETVTLPQTDSKDVTVTYNAGAAGTTTYGVEITWESMSFTWNAADTGSWNPATHQYDTSDTAEWADNTATVTVANHSNAAVSVTIAYTADDSYTGDATASLSGGDAETLDAWNESADSKVATLTVSGTPATTDNAAKIGTVTVTISAVAAQ